MKWIKKLMQLQPKVIESETGEHGTLQSAQMATASSGTSLDIAEKLRRLEEPYVKFDSDFQPIECLSKDVLAPHLTPEVIDRLLWRSTGEPEKTRRMLSLFLAKANDIPLPLLAKYLRNVKVRIVFANTLDKLAWVPLTDLDRARYLIAKREFHKCASCGIIAEQLLEDELILCYKDEKARHNSYYQINPKDVRSIILAMASIRGEKTIDAMCMQVGQLGLSRDDAVARTVLDQYDALLQTLRLLPVESGGFTEFMEVSCYPIVRKYNDRHIQATDAVPSVFDSTGDHYLVCSDIVKAIRDYYSDRRAKLHIKTFDEVEAISGRPMLAMKQRIFGI